MAALDKLIAQYNWDNLSQTIKFLAQPAPCPVGLTDADFPDHHLGWVRPSSIITASVFPCIACGLIPNPDQISHIHTLSVKENETEALIPVCKACLPLLYHGPPQTLWEYYERRANTIQEYNLTREVVAHAEKRLQDLRLDLERLLRVTQDEVHQVQTWLCRRETLDQQYENLRNELEAKQVRVSGLQDQLRETEANEKALTTALDDQRETMRLDVTAALRSVTTLVQGHFQQLVQTATRSLPPPTELKTPICAICKLTAVNTTLNCGHVYCEHCAKPLHMCPMCQQVVTQTIRLYL